MSGETILAAALIVLATFALLAGLTIMNAARKKNGRKP